MAYERDNLPRPCPADFRLVASRTVIGTATSVFTSTPKAGGKLNFAGRLERRNLRRHTRQPKARLQNRQENRALRWAPGAKSASSIAGECTDYKRLDPQTQHVRRLILESTFDEPIAPGSAKLFRDMPLNRMGTDAVEVLRDRKIDLPGAANNRVKAIRQVFKFGMRKKHADGKPYVSNNPARDVEKFKYASNRIPQLELRRKFANSRGHHPVGTKARLALALLLFTGQRRADVIQLGRQHVRNGKLTFTQRKGRHRKPKQLTLPILPVLQRVIDGSPCGDLTSPCE